MAGQIIANDLGRFKNDINSYTAALQNLNSQCSAMFESITSLDNTWDGQAHDAFKAQFDNDYNNMMELITYLSKLRDDFNFANTEYTKCEQEVGDIVSSIKI